MNFLHDTGFGQTSMSEIFKAFNTTIGRCYHEVYESTRVKGTSIHKSHSFTGKDLSKKMYYVYERYESADSSFVAKIY